MSRIAKRQEKKTERIKTLAKRGAANNELEIVDTLEDAISDSTEDICTDIEQLSSDLGEAVTVLHEAIKKKSEEEYEYELSEEDKEELRGKPGAPGKNYVLTEADKQEIASKIKPVEKVIERTTVRTEVPIVTRVIEEVAMHQTPEEVRDGLESLDGDERLDYTAIKGLEDLLKKSGAKGVKLYGGTNGIFLYVDGVKKGIVKTLDFVGATYSLVNGRPTITMAGGGANIKSEKITGVQVGQTVTLDLTTLAEDATGVLSVFRQGQLLDPANWSVNAGPTLLTISAAEQADASEVFVVQYTY